MLKILAVLTAIASLVLISSCGGLSYYWQGMMGQLELLQKAQSIESVLAQEATDAQVKRKLRLVLAVREFAVKELALPDNGSYRSYADLQRPFVVWNVFATLELSMTPNQWCFPVAGCVSYRGYFNESEARAEADRLRAAGFDVHVGGVPAYSTLGYFSDPVLNTFIHHADFDVARLIFHELAHQVVYLKGDTVFNESFAVSVEEEGIRRWLTQQNDRDQLAQYARIQRYRAGFRDLILSYRQKLTELYASDLTTEDKRRAKKQVFAQLEVDYAKLKEQWGGFAGYDRWFAQGVNNASIASIGLYTEKVPAFQALLDRETGNLARFYQRVGELASLSAPDREKALALLARARGSISLISSMDSGPTVVLRSHNQ